MPVKTADNIRNTKKHEAGGNDYERKRYAGGEGHSEESTTKDYNTLVVRATSIT
jgi:hypothetical protein